MFNRTQTQASILIALFVLVLSAALPAAASSAEITLAWDKPADSDIIGYKVYCGETGTSFKNSPYTTIDSADQTSCLISGLQAGLTYDFTATAVDAAGQESDYAMSISYTVPESNEVTLTWEKPADSDLAGYNIYFGESGTNFKDAPYKTIGSPDQTSCVFSGLESGVIYCFTATSVDLAGQESNFSEELYYSVPEATTDSDGDGLTDSEETDIYGTNPYAADTDADGLDDYQELSYWGADWSSDPDGDGLINILDADSDNDGIYDGTEISQGSDPTIPEASGGDSVGVEIVFETGEIEINHTWAYVSLSNTYVDPVVIAKPMSHNGGHPSVIRIDNVTPEGFDIRVQEWDYLDGNHVLESVGYLVMESGSYELSDGTRLEAGIFAAKGSAAVAFSQTFNQVPVVMCGITTQNELDAVTGRIHDISTDGFSIDLQEEQASKDGHGAMEIISYIAWEPSFGTIGDRTFEVGRTGDDVTHDFHYIPFSETFSDSPVFVADMQTMDGNNTANIRWRNKDAYGVEVQIDEEQSRNPETKHTTEVVGYLAIQ